MANKILPDVIIIGAMKAGTTSLYEFMAGHEQIGVSAEKETDFFIAEKNWRRGLDWYHNLFRPGFRIYAEASPNYTKRKLFSGVPERIAGVIPDCKFIFLSRDPVKRAESHYRHAAQSGIDVAKVQDLPGSRTLQNLVDASSYSAQLAPYLDLFPRESFLLLRFEDLIQDPAVALEQVSSFLGIANAWPDAGAVAKNSAETVARLPRWIFAFRETQLASAVKRRISRKTVARLKGLASQGTKARTVEPFTDEVRELIAKKVSDDQKRFTALQAELADLHRKKFGQMES